MTQYATKQNFLDRFGDEETLGLCSTVAGGTLAIDDDRLNVVLNDASREVDGYIAVRYPLELLAIRTEFPEPLTRAVCDIARYFLYKDAPPEQVAVRYAEVTKWLVNVAKGTVMLVFTPPLTSEELQEVVYRPSPVVGLDEGGVFATALLDRMPAVCPLGGPVRVIVRR